MTDFSDLGGQAVASPSIDFSDLGGKPVDAGTPWSKVPENAVSDIEGMIKGAAEQGKRFLDPTGLGEAVMKGSTEPIKAAAKEPINQAVGFAKDIGKTIAHPIETFKEHPIGTAMNAAMVAAPFMGGPAAEGALPEETAPLAEKVAPEIQKETLDLRPAFRNDGKIIIGEPGEVHADIYARENLPENAESGYFDPKTKTFLTRGEAWDKFSEKLNPSVSKGPEAEPVKPEINPEGAEARAKMEGSARAQVPSPPPQLPEGIKEFLEKQSQKIASRIPSDIKDFAKSKTEQLGEKGANPSTLAQYATEHGRNMTLKSLGAAPGQIRKIGIADAQKLADYANEKGIVDLKTGDIGARQKAAALKDQAGQMVGDMRELAAKRGATHNVEQLIGDVHSKLGDKYESGIHSGEKATYVKALEEVAKTPGTPSAMADTISRLFQKAKNDNMAQNMRSLKRPEGPYADVARELRTANEGLLTKTLNPKELNAYHSALEDYGANTQLAEFLKMKQSRDMGGRLPPGMGVTRAAFQKALDVVGYRAEGQIVNRVAKWLRENPGATVKAKDVFRKYVDEAAEAAHEIGEGLQ